MTNTKKRITAVLTATILATTLAIPATAAEAPTIRMSSYKGSILAVGERSDLIIGPTRIFLRLPFLTIASRDFPKPQGFFPPSHSDRGNVYIKTAPQSLFYTAWCRLPLFFSFYDKHPVKFCVLVNKE